MIPGRADKGGLRIAGHDGYPLCPYLNTAFTTVAQNADAIGRKKVFCSLQVISGDLAGPTSEVTFRPISRIAGIRMVTLLGRVAAIGF